MLDIDLKRKYRFWRLSTFVICCLAYAGLYLTRKAFAIAKIGMKDDQLFAHVENLNTQFSLMDTSYLIAYAIGQFIWGISGDRYGTRIVVLGGMSVSVLSAWLMGVSTMIWVMIILLIFQGLAQSTGWAPIMKNLCSFYSRNERGRVIGLFCMSYSLGAYLASWYAGYIGDHFGWKNIFIVSASTLLGIIILFYFFQRNRPEDVKLPPIEIYHGFVEESSIDSESKMDSKWSDVAESFKNPMTLFLGSLYFLLKPTRYAIMFWGPLYVHGKLAGSMVNSALVSGMFFLAGPLGAYLGGEVSDRFYQSRRMPVCAIGLICLSVVMFCMDYLPSTSLSLSVGMFLAGFFLYAVDIIICGVAAVDFSSSQGRSTAAGIVNGMGSVGAIAGGAIPGLFHESWGWDGVFLLFSVCSFVAACLVLPKWNVVST